MKQSISKIKVVWKYQPAADAEARLRAAFEMILSKNTRAGYPQIPDLTENNATIIMSHDLNS
jgi:hypothetical protein